MCEGWLQRAKDKAQGKEVPISAEAFPKLAAPAS
jgi:hypothetical protein